MKRISALALCVAMMFSFTVCGGDEDNSSAVVSDQLVQSTMEDAPEDDPDWGDFEIVW